MNEHEELTWIPFTYRVVCADCGGYLCGGNDGESPCTCDDEGEGLDLDDKD